jgi:UTP:GlnB (protein PII) uridylyltransferase
LLLLLMLTICFSSSVKKAKISTLDTLVMDVFNVVDGRTKGPLSEPREEEVRKRILERLAERRLEQEEQ